MINIQIIGGKETVASLEAGAAKIQGSIGSALESWAAQLASYIKASKLSGDPLHRRSGNLSASVHPIIGSTTDSVFGGAGAGLGLAYAAIHEYGGWVRARVAINAKALMIPLPTGVIFRKSARGFQMPERSYMRSSLNERAPSGIEAIRAAIKEAIIA